MKVHVWRSHLESLPGADSIARIMPMVSPKFLGCGSYKEDHMHLFRDCPLASATRIKFLPHTDPNTHKMFFELYWKNWLDFNLVGFLLSLIHI